jgi:hypothetical protein
MIILLCDVEVYGPVSDEDVVSLTGRKKHSNETKFKPLLFSFFNKTLLRVTKLTEVKLF